MQDIGNGIASCWCLVKKQMKLEWHSIKRIPDVAKLLLNKCLVTYTAMIPDSRNCNLP